MPKNHPLRVLVGLLLLGLATSVLVAWGASLVGLKQWNGEATRYDFQVLHGSAKVRWSLYDWPLGSRWWWSYGQGLFVNSPSQPEATRSDVPRYATDVLLDQKWTLAYMFAGEAFDARQSKSKNFAIRTGVTPDSPNRQFAVDFFGWPLRCCYRELVCFGTITRQKLDVHVEPMDSRDALVPLRFLWMNLAFNTAFYVFFWSLPLVAFPAARRHHRRRRGLCARCGYELAGLATCPECGSEPAVIARQTA